LTCFSLLSFAGTVCKTAPSTQVNLLHIQDVGVGDIRTAITIILWLRLINTSLSWGSLLHIRAVGIEDKTMMEQLRLIQELEEKDKTIIFSMLDTMLTKKKFKDFFAKNVAML
jgi:hypothetical protein